MRKKEGENFTLMNIKNIPTNKEQEDQGFYNDLDEYIYNPADLTTYKTLDELIEFEHLEK